MKIVQAVVLLVLAVALLFAQENARVLQPKNQGSVGQEAIDTSVCQVLDSPDQFDGKLLHLHAYLSVGFENSTLHDPSCPEEALVNKRFSSDRLPGIWVEFADHATPRVKGFPPLVEDEQLQRFRLVLSERARIHQMASATMTGTFYAAKPGEHNGRKTPPAGYGHMGCCNLLVISRIESADTVYAKELNYSPGDWNVGMPEGCYSEKMLGLPTNEMIRSWQQAVNDGRDGWRNDPRETAEDQLKKLKSGAFGSKTGGETQLLFPKPEDLKAADDQRPTEKLLELKSTTYLKSYQWIEPDRVTRYVIVVTRPYWLQKVAGSSEKVIWAAMGASVLHCKTRGAGDKKP